MAENYRQYVEMYAKQFQYSSHAGPQNNRCFIKASKDSFVLMQHSYNNKYVTFMSTTKPTQLSMKAGDLLLCVIEESGLFKEETFKGSI